MTSIDKSELRFVTDRTRTVRTFPNSFDVHRTIAQRILANYVHLLDRWQVKHMQTVADVGSMSSLSIEFRRGEYTCTMYAGTEFDFSNSSGRSKLKDEAGNPFTQKNLKFEVNWSACGSKSPADAMVYSELLREVSLLAATLESEFRRTEVYDCYQTAEEHTLAEEKRKQDKIDKALRVAVAKNRGGMRVNSERFFDASELEAVGLVPGCNPDGAFTVEFNDYHNKPARVYKLVLQQFKERTRGYLKRVA